MAAPIDYLDRMLDPLAKCLTPEVAKEIAALRADSGTQAKLAELAEKSNAGELSDAERDEYESYVHAADIIAILQSKARRMLAATNSPR